MPLFTLPRRGAYHGRLAFDGDNDFHLDPSGRRVVTDDAGKTWRYATRKDRSHNSRYHQGAVHPIVATTDEGFLTDSKQAHHKSTLPSDAHFFGIHSDPDHVAERVTSHTDAYKEAA